MMFGSYSARYLRIKEEEAEFAKSLHGSIGGVYFDFRHDLLQPDSWQCPSFVSEPAPGRRPFHIVPDPENAFVQNPFATTTNALTGAVASLGGIIPAPETTEQEAARARTEGKDVLFPGDGVRVTAVRMVALSDDVRQLELSLEPDHYAAILDLEVKRSDGQAEAIDQLVMLPRGNMIYPVGSETLRLLEERIPLLVKRAGEQVEPIIALGQYVNTVLSNMADELWKRDNEHQGLLGLGLAAAEVQRLRDLVNRAALYGYRQARLEAEAQMGPLARAKLEQIDQARAAGSANAITGRVEFASRYWADNPTATTHAVVQQYINGQHEKDCTEQSVRRSIERACPPTSPSYPKIQAKLERAAKRKEAKAKGTDTPRLTLTDQRP